MVSDNTFAADSDDEGNSYVNITKHFNLGTVKGFKLQIRKKCFLCHLSRITLTHLSCKNDTRILIGKR